MLPHVLAQSTWVRTLGESGEEWTMTWIWAPSTRSYDKRRPQTTWISALSTRFCRRDRAKKSWSDCNASPSRAAVSPVQLLHGAVEVELCARKRWLSWLSTETSIVHLHGRSSGCRAATGREGPGRCHERLGRDAAAIGGSSVAALGGSNVRVRRGRKRPWT